MLENPPYNDETSDKNRSISNYKNTYVKMQMQNDGFGGATPNDFANRFTYSAFKDYLRKANDSYILFRSVKYFNSIEFMNKKISEGKLLNRKHF